MDKHEAYALGYEDGTYCDINSRMYVPTQVPEDFKGDYLRGVRHAIEDRIS